MRHASLASGATTQQQSARCSPSAHASSSRTPLHSVSRRHAAMQPCRPHQCQQQHLALRQQPGVLPGAAGRRSIRVASTQPDTEEARSPLDAPQEWEAPLPSKRPDIFPEFDKPERVFLPKPLPGDPEMPDEEEEEAKKRTEPGDPDPEAPPGEPAEPEGDPGQGDPDKQTNIPTVPE